MIVADKEQNCGRPSTLCWIKWSKEQGFKSKEIREDSALNALKMKQFELEEMLLITCSKEGVLFFISQGNYFESLGTFKWPENKPMLCNLYFSVVPVERCLGQKKEEVKYNFTYVQRVER